MIILTTNLTLGAKIVTMPKYNIETFLRMIKEQKATFLHLIPPVVIQINNYENCNSTDFERIRNVICAASNLAESDGERFKKMYEFF